MVEFIIMLELSRGIGRLCFVFLVIIISRSFNSFFSLPCNGHLVIDKYLVEKIEKENMFQLPYGKR